MIKNLNLSLSNRCTAKCVWCPETRGTKNFMDMDFSLAKKLIDEISSPLFPWKVERIELGENGEALYNKDIFKITSYIREKCPDIYINMSNNFSLMKEDIAEKILRENHFDGIQVNIDGHDYETYYAVKKINFNVVIKNLKKFIELRKKLNPKFALGINMLPLFEYTMTVGKLFNYYPVNLTEDVPYSSIEMIKKMLSEFVTPDIRLVHASPGMWAERPLIKNGIVKYDQTGLSCPMKHRVENEAFIAPNGDWYPCCLDDNNDIVLGNVEKNTLVEIHNSKTRKEFLDKLLADKVQEIGYPCDCVVACQTFSIDEQFINQFSPKSVISIKKV